MGPAPAADRGPGAGPLSFLGHEKPEASLGLEGPKLSGETARFGGPLPTAGGGAWVPLWLLAGGSPRHVCSQGSLGWGVLGPPGPGPAGLA